MDATEDQESQKTSTTPLSNQRSSRSSTSKRRADASVRPKARSSDKRSKEASENDSKVDTDNSRRMARFAYRAVVFTVIALVVVIIAILFKHKDATTTAPGATASATSALAVSTTEANGDRVRTVTEASTSWTEAPAVPSVEVNTTSGILKGAAVDVHGVALHHWLGVPYSRLGARSKRFAFAQPVKARSILALDSKAASPPCAQVINDTLLGREDCLRVNVWAPAQDSATAAKRPLLLAMTQDWFSRGTNNLLEWEILAAKADAVVMSPNVRLGVLGYLGRTSPAESGADLAINDAVVAVRWALENAAAFHADPSKLMLVGHGSGAYVLTAAAQALKLNCLRAVLEGPVPGSALPTNAEAVDKWDKLAVVLGCRGNSESERESCFQDAELPDLLAAAANVTFRFVPRWNSSEWPTEPAAIQVQEVIAGVDVDEVRVFFEERVKPWAVTKKCAATVTQLYGCTLEYLFTNRTAAYENLLREFQPNNEPDIVRFLAMLMSGCDTHRIAKSASKAGYHYITEGPGRTLFEPVLDVDVLIAFLKNG
nr:acetylcholinesterase-like [Rhipicephalus microplus]